MKRLMFGMALATLASAVSVAAAPRHNTQSSIILNAPAGGDGFAASAGSEWEPSLGESVSFTTSFPNALASTSVYVQVVCYQDGAIVFVTAGHHDRSFLLGGSTSPWLTKGGAATCRADLYYWSTNGSKMNTLASTEFDAQG